MKATATQAALPEPPPAPKKPMLSMTFKLKPGTLTIEQAAEIQTACINLFNAVAEDLDPTVKNIFKATDLRWVDDGNDEMTVKVASA